VAILSIHSNNWLNKKLVKKIEKETSWGVCPECQGRGKKSRRIRKKIKLSYQRALVLFENSNSKGTAPTPPKGHLYPCINCAGSGLLRSEDDTISNEDYPNIAIIGGGIGGVALAVACLHRGIPFTLYERDLTFDTRSQGYGLTLQQASKAIKGLGILSLKKGIVSTRHVVHTTEGKIIGEWGIRKWLQSEENTFSKHTNIHISRQALRLALLEQLNGNKNIKWGHQLVDLKKNNKENLELSFKVNGDIIKETPDLVVGADGIRSSIRRLMLGEHATPLRYLGCIVILGICPLNSIKAEATDLLDSATVFQTANGNERIYMMPYDSEQIMWQLSFPMSEEEAKLLSSQGPSALKEEASRRTQWHNPIPQILEATLEAQISGYPVYDRELLKPELLEIESQITLIGDAAHPMSPFKGQGANQALLDALALARGIAKGCRSSSEWKKDGIRKGVLAEFESEMLQRSATKVKGSADAAEFLHSKVVLHEGDEPRGRCIDTKEKKLRD
jgi:2-polyprenyl-6-methoxyphenol hydroxylase-like FAD-dependent oxidoreductase